MEKRKKNWDDLKWSISQTHPHHLIQGKDDDNSHNNHK